MFIIALFTIARSRSNPSAQQQMNGGRNKKGMTFCILLQLEMELEGVMLNEVNQKEKDKYQMIPVICEFKARKYTWKQALRFCSLLRSTGANEKEPWDNDVGYWHSGDGCDAVTLSL